MQEQRKLFSCDKVNQPEMPSKLTQYMHFCQISRGNEYEFSDKEECQWWSKSFAMTPINLSLWRKRSEGYHPQEHSASGGAGAEDVTAISSEKCQSLLSSFKENILTSSAFLQIPSGSIDRICLSELKAEDTSQYAQIETKLVSLFGRSLACWRYDTAKLSKKVPNILPTDHTLSPQNLLNFGDFHCKISTLRETWFQKTSWCRKKLLFDTWENFRFGTIATHNIYRSPCWYVDHAVKWTEKNRPLGLLYNLATQLTGVINLDSIVGSAATRRCLRWDDTWMKHHNRK